MIARLVLSLGLVLLFAPQFVYAETVDANVSQQADEVLQTDEAQLQVETAGSVDFSQREASNLSPYDGWRFLSCVDSSHECENEAHDHGYHHYRTRSYSRECGHSHYACDGRN